MQQWIKIILSIHRCSIHFWIVSFSIRKTPWILYVWPFFLSVSNLTSPPPCMTVMMVHWPSWSVFIRPPWWSTDFHFRFHFRVFLCTFVPIVCLTYVLLSTPSPDLWLIVVLRGEPVFFVILSFIFMLNYGCIPPMPLQVSLNTASFSSHNLNPSITNNNRKHPPKSEVNDCVHPAFYAHFLWVFHD